MHSDLGMSAGHFCGSFIETNLIALACHPITSASFLILISLCLIRANAIKYCSPAALNLAFGEVLTDSVK